MFKAWNVIDNQKFVIKSLWAMLAMLGCLNLLLGLLLANAPSHMRVFLPPDLTAGASLKAEQIPPATVYAFAFQIFTAINSWPEGGDKDYHKNISAYRNYVSPQFFEFLRGDLNTRAANGELPRQRIMSGVSGMGYQPGDVTKLGNGTWRVNMHLQIIETLEGSVIKSVIMDYPLIVSRVRASIQVNPWGLAISGFKQQPYRIKTMI